MSYEDYPDREARDAEIRLLAQDGRSIREIAAAIGCNYETVREVIRPGLKARRNAERAAYNTSPEGLQRQRDYRARKSA